MWGMICSVILLTTLALGACYGKGKSPPCAPMPSVGVSMASAQWNIQFSSGMPLHPSTNAGGGWYFDFPAPPGSVHYVTTAVDMAASENMRAVIQVSTTGAPIFHYRLRPGNTCDVPAHVRLYLQQYGDDMTATKEFYRWWSNPAAYTLEAGSATLDVPFAPDRWTSVFGKRGTDSAQAEAGFKQAIANLANVGFTFGGGCFFGHGVNVTGGAARFVATAFSVQ